MKTSPITFDPSYIYRIAFCKEAQRNVLQLYIPETHEWFCLHTDTVQQEHEEMEAFLKHFQGQLCLTGENLPEDIDIIQSCLELHNGHLISPECGVDITLWPNKPGDKPTPITIMMEDPTGGKLPYTG